MKVVLAILLVLWAVSASADGLINRGRGASTAGGGGGGGCNGVLDLSVGCITGLGP